MPVSARCDVACGSAFSERPSPQFGAAVRGALAVLVLRASCRRPVRGSRWEGGWGAQCRSAEIPTYLHKHVCHASSCEAVGPYNIVW